MKRSKHKKEKRKVGTAANILKAELLAVAMTLALIALVSFLLFQGILSVDSLSIINTVIKVLGTLTAAVITACLVKSKVLVMCVTSGIIYVLASYAVLSLFIGKFIFSVALLSDLAIGAGAGFAASLICGGMKKS